MVCWSYISPSRLNNSTEGFLSFALPDVFCFGQHCSLFEYGMLYLSLKLSRIPS